VALGISEEHEALHQAARRFLESRCPPSVPRVLLDAAEEGLPPFWDELAGLGWLGLHLPEAHGGQGHSLVELAVVLEELGRAVAPGPFLPTVLASAVIVAGGTTEQQAALLPGLATGKVRGAVAFSATDGPTMMIGERAADGLLTVGGTARTVLGASLADLVVLPVAVDDAEVWCVLDEVDLDVVAVPSVDATRRLATVTVANVAVPRKRQLGGLTRLIVDDLVAVLVASECSGGAEWCLDTAVAYAKVREQFGRPIGQFQAVKHKCADMLLAVEQARSTAWDAATAMSSTLGLGPTASVPDGESALAASVAGTLAPDAFVHCAKECVQILGGIGFTWEHDAHLYLKRAISVRQLLGGAGRRRARTTLLALSGVRRRLQLDLPEGADALRDEVRVFAESIKDVDQVEQRRKVVDGGYFVPHWPPPWGRGAGAVEQLVIEEEFRAARVRRPNLAVGAWAAPTIVAHGTAEQQERWVRPTLLGHISWCQMFSEPGAGSDLAALSTKAVRSEAGWLLTGQKVWTSMAGEADWAICLARTQSDVPKHLGITYFLVDMTSPGIEVRPLRELTGHAMFNEIFLSDVFVPDDCVVGEVDGGWPLARTTLANERVAMGSGSSFGGGIEALLASLGSSVDDPVVADAVGALVAEAQSVALLGLRTTVRALSGAKPGPESSVRKLLGVEHDQRVQEFGMMVLGPEGATTEGRAGQWTYGFLANRCLTIAGGTSEVQRNVIAERLLGLPRDPEPGR
jgi:alkylation response protein AidB-like acyl-CoA dehydrogenase